ncbi:hypothetical protein LJ737_23760 [Hymenobacter sp. 15J16-1T3B]|uniref:hypothetical protein n=1 Tax=Hymenobacter sp. 15J16-1T3B TaxID=2886941 RepID=UPI001D0F91A8|nr:hypothetical protein [Hymenobacter sp. 15J16-1T3B]MCC3160274.1 hypothetical protein [Hymenobacter sp. 15J16-1T3B]
MVTSLLKSWWLFGLVAALVLLMAFALGSPFAKGGMAEADKNLALAGLLAGAMLLGAASGLRGWANRLLLPVLAVPVLLLTSLALISKGLDYTFADPEREPFNHELCCGLLYVSTLVWYQVLLTLCQRFRRRS